MMLFPDQIEFVDSIRSAFRSGARSVVGQAGTGFGKTHAAAVGIIAPAVARGHKVAFVAGLDAIITDTYAKVTAAGIQAGIIQAGRPSDPSAPVQVCTQQTLHAREERPPADLVILDECHHAASISVREILDSYPRSWLLGLTATCQRGDSRPLGDVFERLVCGPSNRWLVEHGRLVPCDVLAPAAFQEKALSDDPDAAYAKHTPETRATVFAANVAHATKLVGRFNARGIGAALFVGETPREERERLRTAVAEGSIMVLVGVAAFIEGFDLPSVETIILARPFTVTGGFLQAIGRGRRLSPATGKKRCTVIDLRGSVHLHGLPDEDRVWSLEGKAVRRAETILSLRRCTECLAIFAPSARCPRCGATSASAAKIPRVLTRAEKLVRWNDVPAHERDRRYLARLVGVARQRMRMPPHRADEWARKRFEKQFGRAPVVEAA